MSALESAIHPLDGVDLDGLALRQPYAVITFGGWIDAGAASTGALSYLVEQLSAQKVVELEPEPFYSFSDTRPGTRLMEIGPVLIKWPHPEIWIARLPEATRDLVLFSAPEPNLRWRTFADTLVETLARMGVTTIISLGTILAPIHYRAQVPLRGWASEKEHRSILLRRNIRPSGYEGPTGIATAVLVAARAHDLACVGITGSTPSYLTGMAFPSASIALLRTVAELTDVPLPLNELDKTTRAVARRIDSFLAERPELQEQIDQLGEAEASLTTEDPDRPASSGGELPSADVVLRDLEEFLRQARTGEDEPEADA